MNGKKKYTKENRNSEKYILKIFYSKDKYFKQI